MFPMEVSPETITVAIFSLSKENTENRNRVEEISHEARLPLHAIKLCKLCWLLSNFPLCHVQLYKS